jgi:hypothetical protein
MKYIRLWDLNYSEKICNLSKERMEFVNERLAVIDSGKPHASARIN